MIGFDTNKNRSVNSELYNELKSKFSFKEFGLVSSKSKQVVTFIDSIKFARDLISNSNISVVITTDEISSILTSQRPDLAIYISSSPRYDFYSAYNAHATIKNSSMAESNISPTSYIHSSSFVSPTGVTIEDGVTIEPMVTILPGTTIKKGALIRSGTTIGAEGFEHKRTESGILSVVHDGRVIIGEDVEIGANNTIARGLLGVDTVIGSQTKTDCLVHIAHSSTIGERCLIAASAMIAGSVKVGSDVWIGPNATISSGISIGRNASVTLGSVVTRDVPDHERVTGNFAIEHKLFLKQMAKSTRTQK